MENTALTYPSKNSNNSSKKVLLVLGLIGVVVLLYILLLLNFVNVLPLSQNNPQIFGWLPHQAGGNGFKAQTEIAKSFPIDPASISVSTASLYYTLEGVNISAYDPTKRIVTVSSTTDPNLQVPQFTITDDTVIAKGKIGSPPQPANIGDLNVGLKVNLSVMFDAKNGAWDLKRIFLFPERAPNTASPSAL